MCIRDRCGRNPHLALQLSGTRWDHTVWSVWPHPRPGPFGGFPGHSEVVAGGRRTEKRRRSSAHAAAEVATRNAFGYTEGGKSVASSEQTNSGWSEDEEGRQMVIREYATRRQVVTESRRGYTVGAAWDEGNMIQAMARLKNPTIMWRYGDG